MNLLSLLTGPETITVFTIRLPRNSKMAKKKNKHNAFRITHITSNGKMLTHLVVKKTKQAAARRAFRLWIKAKKINNQPRTTCDGWFEGTTVDLLY